MLIAIALALVQEPGEFVVRVGVEETVLKSVKFAFEGDILRLTSDDAKPGAEFWLQRTTSGWTRMEDMPQEVWLTASRGGPVSDLILRVTSQNEGRLQGQWLGTLTEPNGSKTKVSGTFDLKAQRDGEREGGPRTASGIGCVIIGLLGLLFFAARVWFVIVAFQESAMWGIGVILCDAAWIIFAILHFQEARRPFFACLGTGLLLLGAVALFGQPDL